ncbi:hypothetical protein KCMC57_up18280 [Kitasatospora sp. CMC57]|uniref:Uncharacterized protein n=1 Tax=Kitasatospora sp. CMC57 TaxID=3231513 RepID=A0AB33JS20_9ACTN
MTPPGIAEPRVGQVAGDGAEQERERGGQSAHDGEVSARSWIAGMAWVSSLRVRALDRRTGGESLLASGSGTLPGLPTAAGAGRRDRTSRVLPGDSGGTAPDSHRLPLLASVWLKDPITRPDGQSTKGAEGLVTRPFAPPCGGVPRG